MQSELVQYGTRLMVSTSERLAAGITTGSDWPNSQEELNCLQGARLLKEAAAEIDRLRAALAQAGAPEPTPAGFELKYVHKFEPLMAALERALEKGYMPDAMIEQWVDFDYRSAPVSVDQAERVGECPAAVDDERERFEAWALSEAGGWWPEAIARVGDGYFARAVNKEWRGWKARVPAAPLTLPRLAGRDDSDQPKDHLIREAINELREIAVEFHATQQLRERIARVVLALVRPRELPGDESHRSEVS